MGTPIAWFRPTVRISFAAIVLVAACSPAPSQSTMQQSPPPLSPLDAFTGSFRLETGQVITGGAFVEDGQEFLLYLDVEGLATGGLFRQTGPTRFQSVVPPDVFQVEFGTPVDGSVNDLTWTQAGAAPVSGSRVFPHSIEPVSFESADGTTLYGDLLLPRCAGPHPVIVGGHGSGNVNRYAGMYTTYFLQRGMGVLRYDKRGFVTGGNAHSEPDLEDLAEDVAAAARFAAIRPDVEADRLGVLGTSQGGWVAPAAASATPEIRYLVVRAGPGVNDSETYLHERRYELRAEGLAGEDLDRAMALQRAIHGIAMAGEPISATDDVVAPYLDEPWYETAFGEGPISGRWSARWWGWMQRNFAVDPVPFVERFDGPVLWFLGEKDENVPLVSSRAALQRAFAASAGDDHELVVLEDANHGFLVERPGEPVRFSDGFFGRLGDWLSERGFDDPGCWADGSGD